VLDDPIQGFNFANFGLKANPHDFFLLNNAAVAKLYLDEIEAAATILRRSSAPEGTSQEIVWWATQGLFEFRKGNFERGRVHYGYSLSIAKRERDYRSAALNRYFLMREERRIGALLEFRRCLDELGIYLRNSGSDFAKIVNPVVKELGRLGSSIDSH
jgi:hypothetical protein